MKNYDLIIYCDSYPSIGNGHLHRSLDIINALNSKTNKYYFGLIGRYSKSAKNMINLIDAKNVDLLNNLLSVKSKITILDTMVNPGDVDTIDKKTARDLKKISQKLFVINTGFNTKVNEYVDAIFNYIPICNYTGNLNFDKYYGFKYAPVSKEFFDQEIKSEIDVLCIFGGGEFQSGPDIISSIAHKSMVKTLDFLIIVSPHYPVKDLNRLKKLYPKIKFKQNVDSISYYIQKSKLVICTYGNLAYESMTMWKPTFLVGYYRFQEKFSNYLAGKNVAYNLGFIKKLNREKLNILFDKNILNNLVEECSQEFKIPGIENISSIIHKEIKNVSH